MGCDTSDERFDACDISDEDQDMSDGGAELTMTLSHAENLNAEMDMVDAEIMGPHNLADIFLDPNSQASSSENHEPPYHHQNSAHGASHFLHELPEHTDDVMYDGFTYGAEDASDLPAAMSEVSQQLQHIQDGQEHGHLSMVQEEGHASVQNNMEDQFNLSLGDFLYTWGMSASHDDVSKKKSEGPELAAVSEQRFEDLPPVRRGDLLGERCDIQRINWKNLGVSRDEAMEMRMRTYKNYTNLRITHQWHVTHPRLRGAKLPVHENYFRFRHMDFEHSIHLSHFQLRNLMACTSRDHIFYAGRFQIHQANPSTGTRSVVMDLTNPIVQPFHSFHGGVQISTLTAAHDILIAGGFQGEYGLMNLGAFDSTKHTEGLITDHPNSITNHVQVHLSRHSSLPLAAFASNDNGLRILDVNTNKFIAEHRYDYAVNCSAISPDQRLRVLVGDTRNVMICNSETGEILQELEGHRDYGFACDWADDGWTVATGNQDMQVKIWDARKWTTSQGIGSPVTTIAAEMAGIRKLKFSPLGSGKRVLVAAEPADFVSVIDAETFATKQRLSFFGEIGGVDFTNDGQDLVIANCDRMRGGLMEYERCGFSSESLYGLNQTGETEDWEDGRYLRHNGYDWKPSVEEVVHHPKARRTVCHRRRKVANLAAMDPL
jgi:hypothetical protein